MTIPKYLIGLEGKAKFHDWHDGNHTNKASLHGSSDELDRHCAFESL